MILNKLPPRPQLTGRQGHCEVIPARGADLGLMRVWQREGGRKQMPAEGEMMVGGKVAGLSLCRKGILGC